MLALGQSWEVRYLQGKEFSTMLSTEAELRQKRCRKQRTVPPQLYPSAVLSVEVGPDVGLSLIHAAT